VSRIYPALTLARRLIFGLSGRIPPTTDSDPAQNQNQKEINMSIDHMRLLVVNFAECFHFYRDMLGLKVHWGNENDTYASFTDQTGKVVTLALFARQAMAEALDLGYLPVDAVCQDRSMLIVSVEDVDAITERLQAQGVKFVAGPRDFPDWGIRSAYLRDPDGNLIELGSGLPSEQWSPGLQAADQQYKRE
jgi:catechol 2,3-dioxygenase-like lactoylglutathione lyase family enzyme